MPISTPTRSTARGSLLPGQTWRRFRAIADKHQLSAAIGRTLRADTDPLNATNFQTENLFGVFVTQGLSAPGAAIPYLMQGGIGLPEREYYLSTDAEMVRLRTEYRAYVQQILELAEYPDPHGCRRSHRRSGDEDRPGA